MDRRRWLLVALLMAWGCAPAPRFPDGEQRSNAEEAPRLDADALARETHERINAARVEAGLSPLQWDDTLVPLARRHSEDMARRTFFAHRNPDGEDVNERAQHLDLQCQYQEGNVRYRGFGENLFQTHRYGGYETTRTPSGTTTVYDWYSMKQLAEQAVDAWLRSPGHRQNLLSTRYRTHAVGVAFGGGGRIYFTDVFCRTDG